MTKDQKNYKKLLVMAYNRLNLKMGIGLCIDTTGGGWRFDLSDKREKAIITCPPYSRSNAAVLLHYLCSAKILENGWPRPGVKISATPPLKNLLKKWSKEKREQLLLYWVSRSLDSLLDFFAFQMVARKFGVKYVRDFVEGVANMSLEDFRRHVQNLYGAERTIFPVYTFSLDWFAMFYELLKSLDKKSRQRLDVLFSDLGDSETLSKKDAHFIQNKIKDIRNFYRYIARRYPGAEALLKNAGKNRIFLSYSARVWNKSDIKIKFGKFL